MQGLLKWPLIITAVIVVLRVVLEQGGAPEPVNNLLSVAAMTVVICPLYFAFRIGQSGMARPYIACVKMIALFAVLARAMVLPAYWLAHIYQWPQSRFSGVVGPDVTPFTGFIAVPFVTAGIWIAVSVVVGGALGSATIAATRRYTSKASSSGMPSQY